MFSACISTHIDYQDARGENETVGSIMRTAKLSADGEMWDKMSQAMYSHEFTNIRFGVDRRLREVDRMLQTLGTTTVRILERPDLRSDGPRKEKKSHIPLTISLC